MKSKKHSQRDKWIERFIALALGICLTLANIYLSGITKLGFNPADYSPYTMKLKMEPESHFNYLKESITIDDQTHLHITVGKTFFLQEDVFLRDKFLSEVHKGDIIEYKLENTKSSNLIVEVSKSGTTYLSLDHLNYKNLLAYKAMIISIFVFIEIFVILLIKLKWQD